MKYTYLLTSPSLISANASMNRPEGFDGGTEPICRFSSHLLNPPRNESCGSGREGRNVNAISFQDSDCYDCLVFTKNLLQIRMHGKFCFMIEHTGRNFIPWPARRRDSRNFGQGIRRTKQFNKCTNVLLINRFLIYDIVVDPPQKAQEYGAAVLID